MLLGVATEVRERLLVRIEQIADPPARQPGLPFELSEPRHVYHAGEVPRRNGVAENCTWGRAESSSFLVETLRDS